MLLPLKAATCTKYGPPSVLELVDDFPRPQINKPDEIRVRVKASTVTQADIRIRALDAPFGLGLPMRLFMGIRRPKRSVLGMEMAGEVESIGNGVSRFEVGDQVFGSMNMAFGGYGEYLCLSENAAVAKIGASMTHSEAAAVSVGGRTALHFLRVAKVAEGQKVLVYGASGSVGTYAVQLAKHFGAEVTGVCSGANRELVLGLGADHVIDYTKQDFTESGERYDVIFETVGRSSIRKGKRSLKKNGVFLVANPHIGVMLKPGRRVITGGPAQSAEDLVFLRDLIDTGNLKVVIDRSYALDEIVAAHTYVDSGRKRGNVVINMPMRG